MTFLKYKQYKNICLVLLLVAIALLTSCKKFVEVDYPTTSTNAGVVYNTDDQAIAVLTGIYAKMATNDLLSPNILAMPVFTGLSSDELTLFDLNNTVLRPYYSNTLSSQDLNSTFWTKIYPVIFVSNSALEGLNHSSELTPAIKQQLIGEAKFIRAFCYFYLVSLYGDVPLVLTTDYKVNSSMSRTSRQQVYQQIISDLKTAQDMLNANYLDGNLQAYSGSTERVRPTKWAATALLARVYLYNGFLTGDASNYVNAEAQSTAVINNTTLYDMVSLDDVFLKNSKEAIWQIQPVKSDVNSNTPEGAFFVLPSTGPSFDHPVYLSENLINSFETDDQRKQKWVNSVTVSIQGTPTIFYYPYKYKIGQVINSVEEYSMVLRLGELYLIRAEARAQQNNLSGAIGDLNVIRHRAGLLDLPNPSNQQQVLSFVLHERQVELFTEWGHRWLDLKRTNNVNALMSVVASNKGGTWQTTDQLYPIPQSELTKSPNVIQNLGY